MRLYTIQEKRIASPLPALDLNTNSSKDVYIQGVSKKVDKSEIARYFVKRFNVRTFLLK